MARVPIGTPEWGGDLNADIDSVEMQIVNHKEKQGPDNPHGLVPADIGAATSDDLTQGLAGKASTSHAATHATGGSDEITPTSIGALPTAPNGTSGYAMPTATGSYNGHADDMPLGSFYVPSADLVDGWPVSSTHSLVTCTAHYNISQRQQILVEMYSMEMWVRTRHPGTGEWHNWTKVGSTLTPSEIGAARWRSGATGHAMPVESGLVSGHVDDITMPGVYRIGGGDLTAANGYPWCKGSSGTLKVETSYSPTYLVKTLIDTNAETIWTKTSTVGVEQPWQPVKVDSGWRDVSSWLLNGWASYIPNRCRARREGPSVTFQAFLSGESATSEDVIQFPVGSGFTGYDIAVPWSLYTTIGNPENGVGFVQQSNRSLTAPGVPLGIVSGIWFSASWLTDDPWPTTLPGTPL